MKNTVMNYLNRLKQNRSRQRKKEVMLVCLSLVVVVGVAWSLHMTGESQSAETFCGLEEHQHSEACIEKVLVCGYENTEEAAEPESEPGHVHTDACYETRSVLICTETEHQHSEEAGCYDADGNLICEIPEHQHSEEAGCYTTEQTLICGFEEGDTEAAESGKETASHVHTDECYEITYICGFEQEHQHTLSCYSNPEADVETAEDWEKTFADVELTGVYADDLLAIARTQLGYQESEDNYQVVLDDEGNETQQTKGYTRYGAWYGMPYEDWCAMFVSFCLNYAEVPTEAFPRDAACESWMETLSDPEEGYELYKNAAEYSPYPGDLVFFDTDKDGKADHVGIVSGVTPEYTGTEEHYEDDAAYTLTGFTAIEGNSADMVAECDYELADPTILGYGALSLVENTAAFSENTEIISDEIDDAGNTDIQIISDEIDDAANEDIQIISDEIDDTGNTDNVSQYIIDQFDVVFVSGGTLTDTDGDGLKDRYVWNAADSASGHEFVYRVDYTVSGVETIPAGKFVIQLPLHMLKDADGSWADTFDCPYLNEDDVAAGDTPDLVYRIEGDSVYIYNYSDMTSGLSGYIEFSYTTTETTYNYVDMNEQTEKLEAVLSIGHPINDPNTEEPVVTESDTAAGITINTSVAITSTSKQAPTAYTSWQSSWGDAPADADSKYYFVWPVYTVITKGTQRYDLTLEDTFSDFGGEVIAYRFSGSNTWAAANADGAAAITGQTPSGNTGRYDYVLVSCSQEEILKSLKEQYPDLLADVKTLEAAEQLMYSSGYPFRYTVRNSVTATVHPADGVDADTSASSSRSYTYERLPYESPTGRYYAEKWGIYHSYTRVYDSDDISSYKLTEYLKGTNSAVDGLKYYTYVHGYPGTATLEDGASGTLGDAVEGKYFQKSVTYSLSDKDFSLRALTYDGNYASTSGMGISGTSQTLAADDYNVTALEWSAAMQTAVYDEQKMSFVSSSVRDFSGLSYRPEAGFEENMLYLYVYAADSGDSEGEWLLAATYSLAAGEYTEIENLTYEGANYISSSSGSGASGTIQFSEGVKGYKIETSNPFYYTKLGAYPTISLQRTDHVAQILLGTETATADDLQDLADQEALSKLSVTNTSTGTISREGETIYSRTVSGTDYVSAVVRHSTLTKRIASTLNNKIKRQYEITWRVSLGETYTDDSGDHSVKQESGVFYDLLPAGAILNKDSVVVTASSGALTAGQYELALMENYRGTGRSMLKITIQEATETTYTLSYTTSHSWDAIKDYGKSVLNSVAYETGNEDIGDGRPDDGGTIAESSLLAKLTESTEDDAKGTEKFLYTAANWNIDSLLAANTGLMKQVKSGSDAQYSYSTVVSAGGSYSYQVRFANDALTVSEDIMLFDSLEYFHQNADGAALVSDWNGILTGIDCSQLDEKGVPYTVYVSEVDDLNIYRLGNSGESTEIERDYDFSADTYAKWVSLSEYQNTHTDLSGVRAVAIDARGYRLAAGDSLTYTLYMQAPPTAEDADYSEDGEETAYADPTAYNNIYVFRTGMTVTTDPETGETVVDEDNAASALFHQDYTQIHFRQTGNVLLKKVNGSDTAEAVAGAAYMLRGTSDYGTYYELTVTSGSSGMLSFTGVEIGTYELLEISCTPDWQLNQEIYTVTLSPKEDGTVEATLSGYEYPDQDGDGIWDKTEDGSGNPRYLLTDEPRIHGDLSFTKTDSITGEDVEGAEFKLYGTSSYGNDILMYASSGSDGAVTFTDVEYGSYNMIEISAADGYILSSTVWTVAVDTDGVARIYIAQEDGALTPLETGKTGGYTLENEPYHTVQFLKKSTYGVSNYIGGIRFRLYGTSDYGNDYEQESVSADYYGLVTFDGLEPGTYNLVEADTTGAKDNTYDEEAEKNGLSYPVDSHVYTVTVNADGSYTIGGLGTETVDASGDGDEEAFYVFLNTPENGVITVTKVWLDGLEDSERKPTDIDITVSTDEPDAASFGGMTVTFDANGKGSFSYYGGSASYKLSYAKAADGKMAIFGRGSYVEPEGAKGTFVGWYTDAACTTQVLVNADGYPVDASGAPITPDSDGQRIWTRTAAGGYTLTLYAKYETYNMKYAVRLYGIEADVDADGKTLGLTFGPATGEDYRTLKSGMTGEEAATYDSGSGYVAHVSKAEYDNGTVCLHWMTWDEIAKQSASDPHAFDDCLAAGCTHSVNVDLNNKIRGTDYSSSVASWTGDGAGMFYNSINSGYRVWNQSNNNYGYNYGGWATSRARYTLNGWNRTDKTTYSGTTYLCTESNSLLSCFEAGLRDNIAAAYKISDTGYQHGSTYVSTGTKTSDMLWLFSCEELWGHTSYANIWMDKVPSGVYSQESQYAWTGTYRQVTTSPSRYGPLKNYGETGSAVNWWSRSTCFDGNTYAFNVNTSGSVYYYNRVYISCALAPGFCIR